MPQLLRSHCSLYVSSFFPVSFFCRKRICSGTQAESHRRKTCGRNGETASPKDIGRLIEPVDKQDQTGLTSASSEAQHRFSASNLFTYLRLTRVLA
jgi:hypothetical protein